MKGFIGPGPLFAVILVLAAAMGGTYYYLENRPPAPPNLQLLEEVQNQTFEQASTTPIAATTTQSDQVSISGMSQYIEPSLGFSFWYPSGWMASLPIGGLDNSGPDRSIDLYNSERQNFAEISENYSEQIPVSTLATTTMGGLPVYVVVRQQLTTVSPGVVGTSTYAVYVVPLGPDVNSPPSLVFDAMTQTGIDMLPLIRTITTASTTLPSLEAAQQQTIQIEKEAYSGQ